MDNSLQHRIATSRITLPTTALIATALWALVAGANLMMWAQWAVVIFATYLMVLLNNQNALIRVYSRMVSCAFMVLTFSAALLFRGSVEPLALQACFILFLLFALATYQDPSAVGEVFTAFVFLGVASLFHVRVLYLLPLLWIVMGVNVMSLGWRTFWASVFGVLLPYWFYGAWYLYTGDADAFAAHFEELITFAPLADFASSGLHHAVTASFIAVLAVVGMVHFFHQSYNDKIRTRMFYELFSSLVFFFIALLILQPEEYLSLVPMLIVVTAPLIAHFMALTHTRLTNIIFQVIIALSALLFIFNAWLF